MENSIPATRSGNDSGISIIIASHPMRGGGGSRKVITMPWTIISTKSGVHYQRYFTDGSFSYWHFTDGSFS